MKRQRKLLSQQDALEIVAKFTGAHGQVAELQREYGVCRAVLYRVLDGTYFEDSARRNVRAVRPSAAMPVE